MRIELRRGALRAVTDTQGGELISLRNGEGTEFIWDGDPAFWTGRNPVLFPIVGSLKNGTVQFGGQAFRMGRHGFARRSQFELEEQGEDYVDFALRESEETLRQYPCRFSLRIRHQLLEDGFSTSFTVENTDSTRLPFCIGAHTAFRCPLFSGERFEDYQLIFDQPESVPSLLLTPEGIIRHGCTEDIMKGGSTVSLDYKTFARLDTLIFEHPRSRVVSLLHRHTGKGVRMEFGGFPMVAFWTKPDAPFICLEPWHGCAALDDESGVFEEKPHCICLEPGEKKVLEYTVAIREGNA